MHFASNYARCFRIAAFAAIGAGLPAVSARASEVMPTARQNALVQKYCTVCHTDAANNGGLSLEHFDAAQAAPSLMAMLLSKLTSGLPLRTVREASSEAGAAALVDKKLKSGAMSAAGIPIPDKATIDALIQSFVVESIGAMDWNVQHTTVAAAGTPVIVASILREKSWAKSAGEARAYRLIVSCNVAARIGSMQLAWSPQPQRGSLSASVDGSAAVSYPVEGSEKMGNGSKVVTQGVASLTMCLPLPAETLTITDLFPGETVVFPFANLTRQAHQDLQVCFSGGRPASR